MIKVGEVEYKSFEDVQNIADPILRNEAIHEWVDSERTKEEVKEDVKEEVKEEEKEEEASDDTRESDTVEDEIEDSEKDAREGDTVEKESEGKEEADHKEDAREGDTVIPDESERVKDYATKNNITIDEAEKIVKHIDSIKEKFKGDVDEIAKAAYHAQKAYSIAQEQQRKMALMQKSPFEFKEDHMIFHETQADGSIRSIKQSKEQVVENFRKNHEGDTEKLDDDAVYTLAKIDTEKWHENTIHKLTSEIEAESGKAVQQFFNNLPKKDERFKNEVSEIVNNMTPEQILSSHALPAVLYAVKGQQLEKMEADFDARLKEAEKAAYERGKKDSKIVGEEKPGQKGNDVVNKKSTILTDTEKEEAKDFFANFTIADEEKFKMYESIALKNRKK